MVPQVDSLNHLSRLESLKRINFEPCHCFSPQLVVLCVRVGVQAQKLLGDGSKVPEFCRQVERCVTGLRGHHVDLGAVIAEVEGGKFIV